MLDTQKIKIRTWAAGYKLKDLASGMKVPYSRFIQILNGFAKIPDGYDERIENELKKLEKRKLK